MNVRGSLKLNPSHRKRWAPPVHQATGGQGFKLPLTSNNRSLDYDR